MKTVYHWSFQSFVPKAGKLTNHDGGPYSTRGLAYLAARAAVKQIEHARTSQQDPYPAGPPAITEHQVPDDARTIDESFPGRIPATCYSMDVMRPADGVDCTAGGVSSRAARVLVIVDGELFTEPGPLKPEDAERLNMPVFRVGKAGGRFHLVPVDAGDSWTMFGGNFAYSCDSRTPQFPVHIHDRIEK